MSKLAYVPRLEELKLRVLAVKAVEIGTVYLGNVFNLHILKSSGRVKSVEVCCVERTLLDDMEICYRFVTVGEPLGFDDNMLPLDIYQYKSEYLFKWVLTYRDMNP